ncbi:MAG: hypothetical protein U0793_20400 [Gemmataceae bacterium]
MPYRPFLYMSLLALAFGTVAPASRAGDAASFKQENTPKNLKALFELLRQTIHGKKDLKQAAALFQSLIPDEARANQALRADIAPELLRPILDQHKKMVVSEADAGKLSRPDQTVVKVHAATTEEIAKYEKDSVAFKEFPGGAKRLAEKVLRRGVTFYEVEFLAPGKEAGIKYHLFYWDGKQWSMLGPMWRVIK